MSCLSKPRPNMPAPTMPRLLFSYGCLLLMVLASLAPGQVSPTPPASKPTPADDQLTLSNQAISATWSVRGGSLRWHSLTNHFTGATLSLDGSVFDLIPKEGPVLHSSDLKIVSAPILRNLPGSPYQAQVNSPRPEAPKPD